MATGGGRAFAWQVFPPMPTCRVYGTVAFQDGHLLVLGGCGRAGLPLDTAETLDMASHTWVALASACLYANSESNLGDRVLDEVEKDSFIALPGKGEYSRFMPPKPHIPTWIR